MREREREGEHGGRTTEKEGRTVEGLNGRIRRDGAAGEGVGKTCAVPLGRSKVVPFATVTQPLHVSIRLSNFEFQSAPARTPGRVYACARMHVHTLTVKSFGSPLIHSVYEG